MNVVVVESPAKAKTINKYLGSNYTVLASYGHVRDLPSKDGSVDPNQDFAMVWEADPKAQKRVNEIAAAVKGSKKLILATDPDREGEAISWHVLELLKNKRVLKDVEIERVVFNAITKNAILEAMKNPRPIDQELVDAYLARRALDYLVGFTLSPVLWRKLPGSPLGRARAIRGAAPRSASARLEIEKPSSRSEYWSDRGRVHRTSRDGSHFHRAPDASRRQEGCDKFDLNNDEAARAESGSRQCATARPSRSPNGRSASRSSAIPSPPFTTSTLQQEASRKLGFSATHTMQPGAEVCMKASRNRRRDRRCHYLYANRWRARWTQDAYRGQPQADRWSALRQGVSCRTAPRRLFKANAKNAQEAHEAIRPTDLFRPRAGQASSARSARRGIGAL